MVTFFIIIWLFAGNFIKKESPSAVSVAGIIFYFNFSNNLFKLFGLSGKQSADNSLAERRPRRDASLPPGDALFKNDNAEVVFDFDKNLISDDLILSDHLKKHTKPKTVEELGYYLAGLIEGDGYIGESRIEIAFHMDDISSAYYLKKIIGYGSVLYLKGKNSVRYVLRHRVGLEKVFSLINGKLLSHHKIEQLIKHRYGERYNKVVLPKANFDLLSNH